MATILACTDGSIYAPSVYGHAAWAARRLAADVRLLHVLEPPRKAPFTGFEGSLGRDAHASLSEVFVALDEAQRRAAQAKGSAILEDGRQRLETAGVPTVSSGMFEGSLVDAVEADTPAADLIVLGKRGESADFAKLHLGANLERVIRGSRRPVLVASRAFRPISRVLIAFDGGPTAGQAVAYAAGSALLRGLKCHLLAVGDPTPRIDLELAQAGQQLEEAGSAVQIEHLPGHADEVIARAVIERSVDLLVMGAYGHSRIRKLIVGSTTTAMVRGCQVPVLMFR